MFKVERKQERRGENSVEQMRVLIHYDWGKDDGKDCYCDEER